MSRFATLALVAALALGSLPIAAHADAPYAPPAADTQAVSLFKVAKDSKSTFDHPTMKVKWGRAEIFVKAPVAKAREAILDYGNYSSSFISKVQKSKVLKKSGLAADVFLQLTILKGSVTIWTLEHFDAPVTEGKGEKIVAKMQQGNVEDMQAVWHYRPVDDKHSIVILEIYVKPKLSVPDKLMLQQLEDACGEGVLGVRARAEKEYATVAKAP